MQISHKMKEGFILTPSLPQSHTLQPAYAKKQYKIPNKDALQPINKNKIEPRRPSPRLSQLVKLFHRQENMPVKRLWYTTVKSRKRTSKLDIISTFCSSLWFYCYYFPSLEFSLLSTFLSFIFLPFEFKIGLSKDVYKSRIHKIYSVELVFRTEVQMFIHVRNYCSSVVWHRCCFKLSRQDKHAIDCPRRAKKTKQSKTELWWTDNGLKSHSFPWNRRILRFSLSLFLLFSYTRSCTYIFDQSLEQYSLLFNILSLFFSWVGSSGVTNLVGR